MLATHLDDAQVGVGSRQLRIDLQHLAERLLGCFQIAGAQRGFSTLKELLRILGCTCLASRRRSLLGPRGVFSRRRKKKLRGYDECNSPS